MMITRVTHILVIMTTVTIVIVRVTVMTIIVTAVIMNENDDYKSNTHKSNNQ